MSLRQQEYIVAVANFGTFETAAKSLSVSQPTISTQIRKFEVMIGAEIFDRSVHPIRLTEIGLLVVAQARLVLACRQSLLEIISNYKASSILENTDISTDLFISI